MYTQFFGNFLLNRNVITPQQLVAAIDKTAKSRMKIGTLAMYHNLMNAQEIEDVVSALAAEHRGFGEVAVERHYLTEKQINHLLTAPSPDYLLLGQVLVEDGLITYTEFEDLIIDYEAEHEIYDLDMQIDQKEQVLRLIRRYFPRSEAENSTVYETYLVLLFNNLIRFIGPDFTLLTPVSCDQFQTQYCIVQRITGKYSVTCAIDMDQTMAVSFASRYAMHEFNGFNEYVHAALADFLNLHNGLFTVNLSNNKSVDLHLSVADTIQDGSLELNGTSAYVFPVMYPFGTIRFLLAVQPEN